MSLTVAILDELAHAYGEELPAGLKAALLRIEGASVTGSVTASSVTSLAPVRRSKAAERTRRWRERKRLVAAGETSPEASPSVTEPSPIVTPVTVRDVTGDGVRQKAFPPTPPLEKYQKNTKRRNSKRHPVTFEAPQQPVPPQRFLDEHDARFREIQRMRGRSVPRTNGGWWFPLFEVQQAEERIARTVHHLPSSHAIEAASGAGPPGQRRQGLSK